MSRRKQVSRPGSHFGDVSRESAYNDGLHELPDELIEYVSQTRTILEPPRKRQKVMPEGTLDDIQHTELQYGNGNSQKELEYIVVNQSKWEVKCSSSKLLNERALERTDIRVHVFWNTHLGPQYISIRDDARNDIFTIPIPGDRAGLEDLLLALDVHRESDKWAKGQARIWTEFGIVLLQHRGIDHIQIVFTIKWNLTDSLHHIAGFTRKPLSLQRLFDTYFPDPNVAKSDTWTPQDFYQSVHTPSKEDKVAASININIKSNLYPFQKRAVRWLLRKEGMDWSGKDIVPRNPGDTRDASLPLAFVQTKDAQGRSCFVSSLYGCATLDLEPFQKLGRSLNGGILAEEMGLGKTLETISLITLHRRPQQPSTVFDPYTGIDVRPIGATLIICPPTLVQQWIAEINKHSHLSVMNYEGISKGHKEMSPEQLLDNLASSDIVISTYAVLASEIHYTALNPEKSLRRESKYPRPQSPLMKLSWWRICIDEAQMVESGVSKAAVVARMVPRVNAWCITGTPVRKDVNDLLGLLIFLRVDPYATTKHIWSSLISSHKSEFRRLFGHLALRHNKKTVRNELKLPAQKRYVITMPFTPIEEQHYQELFNQMCREAGLDTEGAPLSDNWDPDLVAEHMRRW